MFVAASCGISVILLFGLFCIGGELSTSGSFGVHPPTRASAEQTTSVASVFFILIIELIVRSERADVERTSSTVSSTSSNLETTTRGYDGSIFVEALEGDE